MKENFKIGNITLASPFILAPLAGFTDKSMRTLCEEQGASLTFTEMVSAKGLKYGDRKTRKLLELAEGEKLLWPADCDKYSRVGFQLFGNDPEILNFAARELADFDNVVLDLNCGCPVPKIVKNGEGSALLKNLDLLHDCVEAMVNGSKEVSITGGTGKPVTLKSQACNTSKPVTAKIRMGFDVDENIAVEAAKAIESAGAAAITVHGRTRQQYYEGEANWQVIADVKDAVRIPVIGNGDIKSGADAIRMFEMTGCDGVMIARGALGNPWIFRDALALWQEGWKPKGDMMSTDKVQSAYDIKSACDIEAQQVLAELGFREPSLEERIDMLVRHLEMVCEDKGESIAVKEMRKFVAYYTKGIRGATAIRRSINTIADKEAMVQAIRSLACSE